MTVFTHQEDPIWLLLAGGQRNLGVRPGNVDFFLDHFVGRRMTTEVKFPTMEYSGKSKRLRDFVSWSHQAPVVSERARDVLAELCGDDVQFIPFARLKRKPYFALNVLRLISVIDREKSDGITVPGTTRKFSLTAIVFKDNRPLTLPPVFKDPDNLGEVFVTKPFAKAVIEHELTGLWLADPAQDQFKLIVRGIDPNVVPGVIN